MLTVLAVLVLGLLGSGAYWLHVNIAPELAYDGVWIWIAAPFFVSVIFAALVASRMPIWIKLLGSAAWFLVAVLPPLNLLFGLY
ncbi:hypothetical protein [Parvularcula lutaonensis]|uniref:Uncharacterized protein n=1 Tax=Parvularcula lutaonensis TaxID=491923 RepID=A0ABV7MC46_9PROT